MKTFLLVFGLVLYCGGAAAQQGAIDWVSRIKSGQATKVIFDAAARKWQDTDRMSGSNPMGTIKAGEAYTVVFQEANGWTVSGYNKGTGATGTWTYQPGRPEDHDLDIWGRLFKFSDNGEVFDLQHGLVGRLSGDVAINSKPANREAEARFQPPPQTQPQQPQQRADVVPATTWATPASNFRGKNGQRYSYACPANGSVSATVWGTDIYTDDSAVCTAAVHAGLLTPAAGGLVTFEIRAGEAAYKGSQRHGISSRDFGKWSGSFSFVGPH